MLKNQKCFYQSECICQSDTDFGSSMLPEERNGLQMLIYQKDHKCYHCTVVMDPVILTSSKKKANISVLCNKGK